MYAIHVNSTPMSYVHAIIDIKDEELVSRAGREALHLNETHN